MKDYINKTIEDIKRQVGNEQVLLGLSGGVDSAVCAALISKAIPNQLVCIFVDHGFMRKNEAKDVISVFGNKDLKLIAVDASERFLKKLEGVTDPEKKRKIIGAEFVEVFNDEALKLGRIKFLAQGTIRSDVVESGDGKSATIKSHHNVGGLPEKMGFTGLVEPLRALYKDQVREAGPGLAIRIIGDITKEKLDMLREADYIYREEIDKLKNKPDQYFAVLTNTRTVGVQKGERTYGYVLALRAVETVDFMKANYARIPHSTLAKISERITDEVKGITRVVFDITGKPPATIEWE
jgi:GMP synthase (glutamine-hydrolysing)